MIWANHTRQYYSCKMFERIKFFAIACIDNPEPKAYVPRLKHPCLFEGAPECSRKFVMKIRNSLKSAKTRDKDCRVVRRKGRVYVINKKNPRFKARQG